MEVSSLTAFDVGVLAIVGLSTIMAFGRGFATVALSFAAWAGALLATIFGTQLILPYAAEYIQPKELADIISYVGVFFISLFLLKFLASSIGSAIKDSPVGFLDRSLGALFGLLRGMVIVSVLYLGFVKIFPNEEQPEWMEHARLKPLVAWGAEMLEGYAAEALGEDPKKVGKDYLEAASDAVESQFIEEAREKLAKEYKDLDREKLDELLKDVVKEQKKKDGST